MKGKKYSNFGLKDSAISGLYALLNINLMSSNYEQRKVARYGHNYDNLIIDTAYTSDTGYFETGIVDRRYYGDWIIVGEYKTRKAAQKGHDQWVKILTGAKLPKILTDVHINRDYKLSEIDK